MFAVHDAAQWIQPGLLVGPNAWVVFVAPLVAIVVVFPWLLSIVWQTVPLADGALRDRLLRVNQLCGVRVQKILLWRSGQMVTNAAVAGILPAIRYVFLSDGLLARLSDDQVAAVYAHEIGHVKHGHLVLRVVAMTVPLLLWHCLSMLSADFVSWIGWTAAGTLQGTDHYGLIVIVGMGVYFVSVFAWYSRLLEHQADLCACRVLAQVTSSESVNPAIDATDRFADVLMRLTPGSDARKRGGLLHPGFDRRIEFLRRIATRPSAAKFFERRMRWLAWFLMSVFLLSSMMAIVAAQLL